MILQIEPIYGVGIGLEVVPEEDAWILDLVFFRFVLFTND